MNVRTFAFVLMLIGIALPVVGWQTGSPAGFVGPVLVLLGLVLLLTRKRHGR